jgi:TolB protein
MLKKRYRLISLFLLPVCTLVHAQLRIEINGVGANQIPIAIATFADEAVAPQSISSIIKDDLSASGYFKVIDTGNVMTETTPINYSDWKSRGANALVVGSMRRLADGRLDTRYSLLDIPRTTSLSSMEQVVPPQSNRIAAHKIADDIYEKLTGTRGIFSTRIAYVAKTGGEYRLKVADADGQDARDALISKDPIISPAWSPDGDKIAYVSFEHQKPTVYIQNLATRQRIPVANFKGSNSAPCWSPDGRKLAVALSRSGLTQIYLINTDGTGLQRLTNTDSIDTEPQFSPDGQSIYFTSDRSGGPQIYKMSVNGGDAQRITFEGDYNISPRISPDGKTLAFISRRDGKFQLYTIDLTNQQIQHLTDTDKDESPSFAPNSKYIMYATEIANRGSLAVVSIDGQARHSLTTQSGDIREPTWGPFIK